mmetsp:Transcript_32404/g.104630  ORF Transcript_32404/g.104630 Transcript_32404/m.104630 type:complete len:213 (-) Transcript_32404:944-1582(-)
MNAGVPSGWAGWSRVRCRRREREQGRRSELPSAPVPPRGALREEAPRAGVGLRVPSSCRAARRCPRSDGGRHRGAWECDGRRLRAGRPRRGVGWGGIARRGIHGARRRKPRLRSACPRGASHEQRPSPRRRRRPRADARGDAEGGARQWRRMGMRRCCAVGCCRRSGIGRSGTSGCARAMSAGSGSGSSGRTGAPWPHPCPPCRWRSSHPAQ